MSKLRALNSKNTNSVNNYSAGEAMVLYVTPRFVLPPKFVNMLKSNFSGVTAASTSLTQSWGNVSALSVQNPFAGTQPITTAAASNGFAVTGNNGSATTNEPDGYSTMSSIYRYYRVMHTKLVVRLRPTNAADVYTLTLDCTPAGSVQGGQVDINNITSAPFFRSATFQYGQSDQGSKPRQLSLSVDAWTAVGLSKAEYCGQPPTLVTSAPANTLSAFFDLNLYPTIAATNTGVIGWELELHQTVEWSQLQNVT